MLASIKFSSDWQLFFLRMRNGNSFQTFCNFARQIFERTARERSDGQNFVDLIAEEFAKWFSQSIVEGSPPLSEESKKLPIDLAENFPTATGELQRMRSPTLRISDDWIRFFIALDDDEEKSSQLLLDLKGTRIEAAREARDTSPTSISPGYKDGDPQEFLPKYLAMALASHFPREILQELRIPLPYDLGVSNGEIHEKVEDVLGGRDA